MKNKFGIRDPEFEGDEDLADIAPRFADGQREGTGDVHFRNEKTNQSDATDVNAEMPKPAKPKIGVEDIRKARETLIKYQGDRAITETRIRENQTWWRQQEWSVIDESEKKRFKPHPSGGQLFSSIISKHADAMDNYPQPDVLPRSEDDTAAAKVLSSVIPCILERCGYRKTYSEVWDDKLISGVGITGVFWDKDKDYVGDIDIRSVDPLMFYSDPHISDIQSSRNVFTVEKRSLEELVEEWPALRGKQIGETFTAASYYEADSRNDSDPDSVTVIDWYYKRDGLLHFCKFVGEEILFADENEVNEDGSPAYPNGWYEHGRYPFEIDGCYRIKNNPYSFGIVDAGKNTQKYIDKLDQSIIDTAVAGARQRYFIKRGGSVNKDDFADTDNEIIECEGNVGEDSIRPVQKSELNPTYLSVKQSLCDDLREATSNREFSNGGTAAGVTSGSAIAALQEAGNKTSRDMIRESYTSFENVCYLIIELIRQFYTEERKFRIVGEGSSEPQFAAISSDMIGPQPQNELGVDAGDRMPVFDIRVVAQKSSAFSREVQNQRAQELYGMGFFAPENADVALAALSMMDFEGKDKLEGIIKKNGTMLEQIQLLQQQLAQLQAILGAGGMMPAGGVPGDRAAPVSGNVPRHGVNAGDDAIERTNTSAADAMRARVQNGASPL